MKKILLKTITSFFCILFVTISLAQNVTIDYYEWSPSSPPCNVFASATNVPATINGNSGTIQHQTLIGQPTYSTTDRSIQLACKYVSSSSSLGTKYRIAYSFRKDYRYIITVTAAKNTSAGNPNLKLTLSNTGGGGGTCDGPQSIDPGLTGNPAAQQITGISSFNDYQFAFSTPLSTAYPTLELAAILYHPPIYWTVFQR